MKKIALALVLVFVLGFACACNEGGAIVSSDLASSTPAREESSTVETSSVKTETESSEEKTSSLSVSDASSEPKPKFEKLSEKYLANDSIQSVSLSGATSKSAAGFSYELFKNAYIDNENVLLSPISALSALTLAANGADGQTLSQMEAALGADKETLNKYLYSYRTSILDNDSFVLSNSVWLKNGLTVDSGFLQANADYHAADIFSAPMNNDTVDKINVWTSEKTNGKITKLINELPANTVSCLINAALFDAKWEKSYSNSSIRNLSFYTPNGGQRKAEFLYSSETLYIAGDGYCGFVKPYSDDRYAFAAFLPDSNSSLNALVDSFDGDKFISAITGAERTKVEAYMPTFSNEQQTDLVPILKSMGMNDAFDPNSANFSKICENCWISHVKQNAKIEVSREGTSAAAATVIIAKAKSAKSSENEVKVVNLNRPFLYAIIDTEANLPIFIGTVSYIK